MNKGFTLAELLIVITILAIIVVPVIAVVTGGGEGTSETSLCDWYKYSPAHQVPIGCYSHFGIQANPNPYVIPR